MNPFSIPQRESDAALCPWDCVEHEEFYAPVDRTLVAFEQFDATLAGQRAAAAGSAVLVHGMQGCGKTALIHRCVAAMKKVYASSSESLRIFDLSSEIHAGSASKDKVRAVCQALVDLIEDDDLLTSDDVKTLCARAGEPTRAMTFLSNRLAGANAIVCVVLPSLELPVELDTYIGLLRTRLFFFLESPAEAVEKHCLRNYGSAASRLVPTLTVGPLDREDDAWEFVSTRLNAFAAAHAGVAIPVPHIEESTVREFMAVRIGSGARPTVLELERTCRAVFALVMEAGRQEVKFKDFGTYYIGGHR
jgi:hypothetical protein